MKRYYSLCFFAAIVFLLLAGSLILCFLTGNDAFAESIEEVDNIYNKDSNVNVELSKNNIVLLNDYNYCIDEEIVAINVKINSEDDVIGVDVSGDYECKYQMLESDIVKIVFFRKLLNGYFKINVNLKCRLKVVTFQLFIIETDQGVFFSAHSKRNAENEWLDYVYENELVSAREKEAISNAFLADFGIFELKELFYGEKVNNRGSKDTFANGKLSWIDDDNISHPLRHVKVELYDANSAIFGDTRLGTVYSNSGGFFHITFQNNDSFIDNYGSDIYIKIYAGDDNIKVVDPNLSIYKYVDAGEGHCFENVSTGETYTFEPFEIDMSETIGQAMQISQATFVARYYAEQMLGTMPHWVGVVYPANVEISQYSYQSFRIDIPYVSGSNGELPSYAVWDVIMHEYGHHVQNELGISQFLPGGDHWIEVNMIGKNQSQRPNPLTKEQAIIITYSEAWASIFGAVAQQYYPYYIRDVLSVCDSSYSFYDSVSGLDFETMYWRYGEACEGSIMAVLWDLYDDTPNELNDTISLSALEWWNVTTRNGTYTFSNFVQNFYADYSEYESALGFNLSYYKISASDLSIEIEDDLSNPPTIYWNNYSGWDGHPFTTIVFAMDEDEDSTMLLALSNDLDSSGRLSQSQWDTILSWSGSFFKVKMLSAQGDFPETGGYYSQTYLISKPQFTARIVDDSYVITGVYHTLQGNITIPSSYFNKTVIGIANSAFSGQSGITSISIPGSVITIGAYAFYGCTNLAAVYMSTSTITRIDDYVFYNCPLTTLRWPNQNVEYIGDYAFYGSLLQRIILTNSTVYIGAHAFGNNNNLTIYSELYSGLWDLNWNSSNRPFIWGCTLSTDSSYVVSFEKTDISPIANYNGTINNPIRDNYNFGGWYTNSSFTGSSYSNIANAPNGMLYAKWNSNSSSSCITTGSLITLADGTQTAVENLTGNEQLLVWDMLNGTFTLAPILFIDSEATTTYDVITLTFSDNTQVEVIDEHAFFDTTLNKYVFLRSDAAQYIGHFFKKQSYDINNNMMLTNVQLVNVSISQQITTAYSPVTYGHLCYYVNGMLSMPGNTESFINIFDVDSTTMAYDQTSMAQDIAIYGLYTYAEFNSIIPIPELVFNAFNGQYLKVAIGKGITTLEEIQDLLNRYMSFFE